MYEALEELKPKDVNTFTDALQVMNELILEIVVVKRGNWRTDLLKTVKNHQNSCPS